MSEDERKLLTWGEVKSDPTKETTVIRKVMKGEYEIVYREMTGDEFEVMTLSTRSNHTRDGNVNERDFNLDLQRRLRKRLLVSVMGKKYEELDDRNSPPWLIQDLNDFVIQYIQGNVK